MKNLNWFKEIFKLILLVAMTITFFILGNVAFNEMHYSSALLGISGASMGLSLFQLTRVIGFARNPQKYKKEQIDVKDERNSLILTNAKASSFGIETFVIFGITVYAIYSNNIGFVFAIFILWVSRIFSFFYYLSKNNKEL
ncbi:hypothetical protein FDF31_08135 [Clostridium sporogenes]|jgi:hypothetical protein|uniref:hypothetical protein n=1 Tax=unclassified Clostridium TaxID=2614128 RepID=UPI0013D744F3|nr:hypothetical protein [Clostridium sporogenes]NFS25604.1 hypothetical protein [Clostridium sporogenes]